MAEKKITKREMFEMLLKVEGIVGVEKFENFINHELELLDRKNGSKNGKPTATQKANEKIKEVILSVMKENTLYTVTELTKKTNEVDGTDYTPNKISALVRQLVADGKITRTEDKRKAYFTIV